eukprot:Trichotokara_eunicae@DN1812_c0_g1_i1.p1
MIRGIFNGTSNFILSKMEEESLSYEDALQQAQAKGYAEFDPTADVEGYDSKHKLALLAKTAWNCYVELKDIQTIGIGSVSKNLVSEMKAVGYSVKLIAQGSRVEGEDKKMSAFVMPAAVEKGSRLDVDGVTNVVEVVSKYLERCVLSGPGAGRAPSANSVVSDLVTISRHRPYQLAQPVKWGVDIADILPAFVLVDSGEFLAAEDWKVQITERPSVFRVDGVSLSALRSHPKIKNVLPIVG